jgi:ferritin-like metal-binding protein YciE
LKDLYLQELKDIYSAENQILKALPKMIKAASSPELQEAFKMHLEQTKNQVERLNSLFETLGVGTRGKKCEGMEGIIEESSEFLDVSGDPSVKDAALISCAQKVEHYEISSYGTARTFAKMLGDQQAASVLDSILSEEKDTDKKLTQMAEGNINRSAMAA